MRASGMAVQGIALNTFREAIRDRILYVLLVFSLLLIAVSRSLSQMTVGTEEKIVTDLGLSAISVFGVLTAVFLGVSLVFKEIEKRTIFTLLANPVQRWQFVLGKYLSPKLYVGYGVGIYQPISTFRIRYLLSSKWSIESMTGDERATDLLYRFETGKLKSEGGS